MNYSTQPIKDELNHIAKRASELISATADATEGKIVEARNRLADVLHHGREIYDHASKNAGNRCIETDLMMRRNFYPVIAIGIGVGLLAGYLMHSSRENHRN